MILYGELTKVEDLDDGSIRVHGVASTGARDASGEIVTPDAVRAALPGYMAFGAIREMHQPRAAGAALSAEVDDQGATRLCAHVVDPTAVQKVKAGVYKGLSIGGKVLSRDPADPSVITSIRLDEISLVDRPCNPEAVIDLWKAQLAPAHATGPANAPTNAQVIAEAAAMARRAGRPNRRNDYVAAAREQLTKDMAANPSPLAGEAAAQQSWEGEGAQDAPNCDPASTPQPSHGLVEPAGPFLLPQGEKEPAFEAPPAPHENPDGSIAPPADTLAKLATLESDLAAARAEIDRLSKAAGEHDGLRKQLAAQAAEIERLGRLPLPPRTAGSAFAKALAKEDDGHALAPNPDQLAKALDALPPAERAHLLMKAALSRPIPL